MRGRDAILKVHVTLLVECVFSTTNMFTCFNANIALCWVQPHCLCNSTHFCKWSTALFKPLGNKLCTYGRQLLRLRWLTKRSEYEVLTIAQDVWHFFALATCSIEHKPIVHKHPPVFRARYSSIHPDELEQCRVYKLAQGTTRHDSKWLELRVISIEGTKRRSTYFEFVVHPLPLQLCRRLRVDGTVHGPCVPGRHCHRSCHRLVWLDLCNDTSQNDTGAII